MKSAALIAAVWAGLLFMPSASAAEPYRPAAADTLLLQRAPGAAKALRAARGAVLQTTDPVQAAAAARLAIDRGRSSGDPRYFGQALAVLAPWWTAAAPPAEIRLLRAILLQQRHAFAAALADLDALIATDRGNAQARLVRATIYLVQGEPLKAKRDCAALMSSASFLVSATCIAAANGLSGQSQAARTLIEQALAREAAAPPAIRLWALTQLAEISERLGDVSAASEYYATALTEAAAAGDNDVYLQAAYADFLLDQQRHGEVRELLKNAVEFDALLLRLVTAEDRLLQAGDVSVKATRALHLADLLSRYALAAQRNDAAHQREQAMAALHVQHDAAAALRLASQNWTEQREPADARILLEAALASKDKAAAAPVLDWLQASGIEDVRLRPLATQLAVLP